MLEIDVHVKNKVLDYFSFFFSIFELLLKINKCLIILKTICYQNFEY